MSPQNLFRPSKDSQDAFTPSWVVGKIEEGLDLSQIVGQQKVFQLHLAMDYGCPSACASLFLQFS